MGKTKAAYTPEFWRQMVELVYAGRSPEDLSREFEPTAQSIRNWVAQFDRDAGGGEPRVANGGAGGLARTEKDVIPR